MTKRITSRKAKNVYGDWEVVTLNPGGFRFSFPWKFVFLDNILRFVLIKGKMYSLIVDDPMLGVLINYGHISPKKLIQDVYDAIQYGEYELHRIKELGRLKYLPAALYRSLDIDGTPLLENKGLPGRNKRR